MLGKLNTIRNEQRCLFNITKIKTNLHYKVAEETLFELRWPVIEFCAGKQMLFIVRIIRNTYGQNAET
jgi:hypothetical protein